MHLGKWRTFFLEAKYEHGSTFASEHGQNMYVWTIVSNLLLLWLSASVKLKLLSQNVCMCLCVFVGSVVFSGRCWFFRFFSIFHARFCVNFHLLTLSQWNFSERPEKTVRRCGCVAWYGRAWHGRWCALMLVKCFEPDAQMHLHLICVTFCALDYFWMLDASVKLCFMKYSNSGSSKSSWKKRAENKSQTVSSPDFLLIGEREKRRHRLCGTTSATCLFHRSLILFSQLY